ncbi:MAG TPA: cation transporter [Candidatus Dormibacteraeota bacterium]|nr:cation transporter [Candidatus Dormibacteraeota bacterium]
MSSLTQATASAPSSLLRQARLAQTLAVAWLVVELVLAVSAGVLARSIALTAFGADSAVELITAAVVLGQLRSPGAEALGSDSPSARRASRVVGMGLYAVAAYILVASAYGLLTGLRPESTTFGVVVAALSVVVMFGLWRWRLSLSERLHSAPLRADAACSAVCLYMGLTLLAGLALNMLFGWWWADLVAGLGMLWWIVREAREAIEAARTGQHCAVC